jgi:hypothetical protein
MVGDVELNRTMVRNGWALAFVKYSDRYATDQIAAEAAKAGLWAGSFVKPWEWRLGEAEAVEKTRACAIKGQRGTALLIREAKVVFSEKAAAA